MSYLDLAQKLMAGVSDEGEIENGMSTLLFASFYNPKVWSPIDIDCAMPKSSFYIAKLNSHLSPMNVNEDDDDQDENVYLIVRYTKDDIGKYQEYLKFEYRSYMNMEVQVNEIIAPVGYKQNTVQEGFLFAFVTSTNLTLEVAYEDIIELPLQTKFAYMINLIDNTNESLINKRITGFHITPKTVLVNLQNDENSIGIIGFIGEINDLSLCQTAIEFSYNDEFSPSELKKKITPTVLAPNSISDVYGLAKIAQYIIGDELSIPSYKKVITHALQKNKKNRIILNDFLNQMLDLQKEVSSLEEDSSPQHHSTQSSPEKVKGKEKEKEEVKEKEEEKKDEKETKNEQNLQPIPPKERLVDKMKKLSTPLKTEEGCPQIYKLPKTITNTYSIQKLRKIQVGPKPNVVKDEVKILIVGQTGSGKTTFLNGISNYLYGVKWEDDCRFKIVTEGDDGTQYNLQVKDQSQAFSQTDYVTAYTFYWQPDFPVPYTVTLIDTPGFGDTRGIQRDKQLVDQLESLFKNKNDCGVDSLNTVAFVVQSALPRLNAAQQYIFDSIMKLFGKDIKNNFIIIATFADAGEPQVLSAMQLAEIPTNFVSKFNNSALFAKRSGDSGTINHLFWEIGQNGYSSIFTNINKMEPRSLTLTQDVLDERKKLNASIDGLSKRIREGIAKMEQIEQECRIIEQYKTQIKANKNFITKVKVLKSTKVDLKPGEHVTNCNHCNKTCHFPCYLSNEVDKLCCAAMNKKGYCNVCGCHWKMHYNMPFRWETYEEEEERTLEELKQKYGDAKSKKQTREKMLNNAKCEYRKSWELTYQLLIKCKNCVIRLQEIALRPIALSESDYIQLQIEGEKENAQPGWDNRVKWLEELLKQQKLLEAIYHGQENNILPSQLDEIESIKENRIISFLREKVGFKI